MSTSKNKVRRPVTVVSAPSSSFPDFSKFSDYNYLKKKDGDRRSGGGRSNDNHRSKNGIEIDFDETVREIRSLGSTQFTGKQKRQYEDEKYRELTGREKKKQKVPLKIVRGIKKKAAIRERRIEQENKEAGIVTASTNKKKMNKGYSEQNRKDSRIHGPAPSIGFTKNGVLSVRKEKR